MKWNEEGENHIELASKLLSTRPNNDFTLGFEVNAGTRPSLGRSRLVLARITGFCVLRNSSADWENTGDEKTESRRPTRQGCRLRVPIC